MGYCIWTRGKQYNYDLKLAEEKRALDKILEVVEGQIWKSYYITPTNKPKVIKGIIQALKGETG